MVHEPELLILDEPTSGVDPLARDVFWELLVDLSREQGVTIFVSTHFMNEAARCDRISLMHAGRVLATGTPAELVAARGAATPRGGFIGYLEEATGERRSRRPTPPPAPIRPPSAGAAPTAGPSASRRLLAYRDPRERWSCWRDPVRLGFALLGTAFLMLVFGFGINIDVDHLPFAALDRDRHAGEPRLSRRNSRGSRYFVEQPPIARLRASSSGGCAAASCRLAIEIPPGFGRDLRARPARRGRRLDRRRHAVPRRDRAGLRAGRAPALSSPTWRAAQRAAERAAPPRDRDAVPLQPGLQERRRHGAGAPWRCCWP